MRSEPASMGGLRLAELVAALSLASDLGLGQPMDYMMRSCLLALGLGEQLRLDQPTLHAIYHLALLRWIGCTGHAQEVSELFPDEIAARERFSRIDMADSRAVLGQVLRHGGEGLPPVKRLGALAAAARTSPRQNTGFQYRASCEVAQMLAARLGYDDGIRASLWHAFERWDGRGFPNGLHAEELALPMRVVHVAQDAAVFHRSGGVMAAVSVVQQRAGRLYDPAIAAVFCDEAEPLLAALPDETIWDDVVAREPPPRRTLARGELDRWFETAADYVDLKAPSLTGHSRGVAALAAGAGSSVGLDAAAVTDLRRAALLHDIGRCGVPNSVWEKPGRLTEGEWERVRLHPYLTDRILARCPALRRYAAVAVSHHERIDGSGFHRSLTATALSMPARILAAADAYHAMIEPRRYREPLTVEAAATVMRTEARAGRLDGEAVAAVLAAAGQPPRRRRGWPAGLSNREVAVLRLLARGLTTRAIAARLVISERTTAHHIQSVYGKIGVSTRGAAALFAMQNDLVNGTTEDG